VLTGSGFVDVKTDIFALLFLLNVAYWMMDIVNLQFNI